MKTLVKLVRYHRYLVDEKRREVRQLEERVVALEQAIDRLDARMVAERIAAAETDLGSADYGGFTQASLVRRADLIGELNEASDVVEEARNELLEAFAALKRYEISLERKELLQRQSRARQDQLDLDEVSLNGHRRNGAVP